MQDLQPDLPVLPSSGGPSGQPREAQEFTGLGPQRGVQAGIEEAQNARVLHLRGRVCVGPGFGRSHAEAPSSSGGHQELWW
ncbi:unnamed protein product [Linum tenue]|uniref:Uncharacterized protein n=1 Tax=Linum tenue TaxID=586396 RepID=A0AAV0PNC2_9ROSI|nr:unnamed protein product [Linum tenue]